MSVPHWSVGETHRQPGTPGQAQAPRALFLDRYLVEAKPASDSGTQINGLTSVLKIKAMPFGVTVFEKKVPP